MAIDRIGQDTTDRVVPVKPVQVIQEFFSYADLSQVQFMLWNWLKSTVAGSYPKTWSCKERTDLLYFYEQLGTFIEAVHRFHMEKAAAKK